MPAKNKISDLRDHLFETLEALRDEKEPMDIARAKAIAEVAQVIIESAKVEVHFMEVVDGAMSSGFLPTAPPRRPLPATATPRQLESAERLDRITASAPPAAAITDDGEELEPAWNGTMGRQGKSISSWK